MTSNARPSAPLSSHPLFPAAIAVWFAALFGMGSMALRAQLLEQAVLALHLDLVVPAAAPPLGLTARLLVAFLFAGLGALTGYVLARLVARRPARRATTPRAPRKAAKVKAPVPMQAPQEAVPADDDDLARLEAARETEPARRRRIAGALTAEPDIDPFAAPLPVTVPAPSILNLGELAVGDPLVPSPETPPRDAAPAPVVPGAAPSFNPEADPVAELGADPALPAVTPSAPVAELLASPAPQGSPITPVPHAAQPSPRSSEVDLPPPPAAAASEPPARRLVPRAGTAAQVLREAPLSTLGVVELVERFALALAEHRPRARAVAEDPTPLAARPAEASPAAAASQAPPPAPAPIAAPTAVHAVAPQAIAPQALASEPAMAAPFADPNPGATGPGRPFDMPAMLRPALPGGHVEWFDPGRDEYAPDPALDSLLPPRLPGAGLLAARLPATTGPAEPGQRVSMPPAPSLMEDDSADMDDTEAEFAPEDEAIERPDRFSSLLDMKPSNRVAVPDPLEPPVRLPGAAPVAEPAVTEDALREALAALQRMSGAA